MLVYIDGDDGVLAVGRNFGPLSFRRTYGVLDDYFSIVFLLFLFNAMQLFSLVNAIPQLRGFEV